MGECGTSNLHSAWDTCLVLKAVGKTWAKPPLIR
jgi:hypothetical protein